MKSRSNMKRKELVVLTTIFLVGSSCLIGSFTTARLKQIKHERLIEANASFDEFYMPQINIFGIQSDWPQIYDGGPEDSGAGVAIDSNGDIIVTGYSFNESGLKSNFLTIKYDTDGNEIWAASFDSGSYDLAWDLAVDSHNNVIVFGFNVTTLDDLQDLDLSFRIVKYNEDGLEQWNVSYHRENDNYPGGITVDSDDNIIMTCGIGDIYALDFLCWTMKMDENGREIWNQTFREDMLSFGADVTVNSNDDIIVGGMSASPFMGQGFCAIKYDKDGNKIWTHRYGGIQPNGIAIDSNDNVILIGQNYLSNSNSSNWYTIKCDKNGNQLWAIEYDSGYHDIGQKAAVDSKGNIITVGGSFFSGGNDYEHCAIIYDINGGEICMKRSGVSGFIYGVAIDNDNKIIITGAIEKLSDWDYYTDKYFDTNPPLVHPETPKERYLYIFNKEIMPLPKNTLIISQITIKLNADDPSDIEKVEFYIDNTLQETLTDPPYEWTWSERTFGQHRIKTMAYDDTGSIARYEIDVWKLF